MPPPPATIPSTTREISHWEVPITFSPSKSAWEPESSPAQVEQELGQRYGEMDNMRWHAIKMLEWDDEVKKDHPVDLFHIVSRSYEKGNCSVRYRFRSKEDASTTLMITSTFSSSMHFLVTISSMV